MPIIIGIVDALKLGIASNLIRYRIAFQRNLEWLPGAVCCTVIIEAGGDALVIVLVVINRPIRTLTILIGSDLFKR